MFRMVQIGESVQYLERNLICILFLNAESDQRHRLSLVANKCAYCGHMICLTGISGHRCLGSNFPAGFGYEQALGASGVQR